LSPKTAFPGKYRILFLLVFSVLAPSLQAADDQDISPLSSFEVLLRLFDATRGARWNNRTGWLVDENVCQWKGITCYEGDDEKAGEISDIDLSENHLIGSLPSEIFGLPSLKSLTLDNNPDLIVSFEGLSGSSIEELSLTNCQVLSLDGVSEGIHLEILGLVRCQLSGSLIDEIFSLTALKGLFLNENSLTGTIPTLIGLLTNLEQLFMSKNILSGNVPSEIGNLSLLQNLVLPENSITGQIPEELNNCASLMQFQMNSQSHAGLTGNLPVLDGLPNIVDVNLRENNLTGSIPENFLAAAAASDNIIFLDLSYNDLTGEVPKSWGAFTRLRPYLQENRIDGFGDDLCLVASKWLDSGPCPDTILCLPGTFSSTGRATNTESCQPCDSAEYYGSTICLVVDDGGEASTPQTERGILELLYIQTNGDDWRRKDNWMVDDDACNWYGISCNEEGKVVSITMKNNGLSNTLPTAIFSLPSLSSLTLNSNSLSFTFQGIGIMSNLRTLDLTNTNLESLQYIEELNFTALENLRLASNSLQGKIPSSLFDLSNLLDLNLSYNQFTGELDINIGKLTGLERFMAYGNRMQGPLPSELGLLTNLVLLELSENGFTGTLPSELELLTSLRTLSIHQVISQDGLRGKLLPFTGLTQLTSLLLEGNFLSGVLPPDFLKHSSKGDSRIEVRLSDNNFRGVVPHEWADRFSNLFIELTGNEIVGLHDSWCTEQDWMDGAVAEFDCDAILCPAGTYNPYGRRQSADLKCLDCPQGGHILGSRECESSGGSEGPKPSSAIALKELYYFTGGALWRNNTGWKHLSDYCRGWYGVTCDISGGIVKIDLSNNEMSGTLPSSIFKLPSLRELNLGNNPALSCSFEGIDQSRSLEIINFDNVRLSTLQGLSQSSTLKEIHLDNNSLEGTLPNDILDVHQLTYLSLENNQFSGRLRSELAALSNLEELHLDSNHLTGPIPAVIGTLQNLRVLSVAENELTGSLPDDLNNLWKLEILDLHRVQSNDQEDPQLSFEGGIRGPLLTFRDSPYLTFLSLSGNSLSGTVPYDFLDGLEDKGQEIYVNLNNNEISGVLPASLAQFSILNIFLSGNKISEIAPGLCKKEDWMYGLVNKFNCEAILCPLDTYNEFGLHHSDSVGDYPCLACPSDEKAMYYGSKQCMSADTDSTIERQTLKEFFNTMDGPNWKVATNWLDDGTSICLWFGVTCVNDDKESVQSLRLTANGLNGTVPSNLFKLSNLNEIDISHNDARIIFDNMEEMPSLINMNLERTHALSLSSIAKVSQRIERLHISDNDFTSLPTQIFKLRSLQELFMSRNDFGGRFPLKLTKLTNLRFLSCDECQFSGTLPDAIRMLTLLELLSLSRNELSGQIPSGMSLLTELRLLDLSSQTTRGGSGLKGSILNFEGMTQLVDINLAGNSLSGSIPSSILQDVASTDRITLDFRNNLLTGSIPSDLSHFSQVNLFLSNNMIDGIPQEICNTSWNDGRLNRSDCDHILCPPGTFNSLGYATRTIRCSDCSVSESPTFFGKTTCGIDIEREILGKIYLDLNGHKWSNNDGWLSVDTICNWYGILCFTEGINVGKVKEIDLSENNLIGTLSNDIFRLEYLESLDLRRNQIQISMNGMRNAINLKTLLLSETMITSMKGIGSGTLTYLHLTSCNITGHIPDEIYSMKKLQGLYMNYNNFEGSLSTKIQQLKDLRELYLFRNKLTGTIPSEIGMLVNLRTLGFGGNQFSGSLPTEINNLSLLQTLSLQKDAVDAEDFGMEKTSGLRGTLPSFDGLFSLRELYLGRNLIEGTIPENFLNGISNTSTIITVDIMNNKLGGTIPSTLSRFDDLRLFVAGNMIDGIPSEICSKYEWMEGLMTSGCDALLCEPGTFSPLGRRNGGNQCKPCAFHTSSKYYGTMQCIPHDGDFLDERSILFQLYHSLDGNNWNKRENWVEDNRSICTWYGVHCSQGENGTVVRLDLPDNGLKGVIPASIYYLQSLQTLNVRENDVELDWNGAEKSNSLEEIYLDATKMRSLKGIEKISTLKVLHLEDNLFGGASLPEDFFDLTNLEILSLFNSGFGGTLSDGIGRLTNLVNLFFQENDFSGTLPTTLGKLRKLEILDMSENNFAGNLPIEIENMTSLQSFFLDSLSQSGAGISGPLIPFSNMPKLRNLFLGSNTLTGSIPENFLASVLETEEFVNIGLKDNSLTGTVPSQLGRLKNVNIALTGNFFEAMDNSLCSNEGWMDGAVMQFGCDAIMCHAGSFNDNGRQTSELDPCTPCPGNETENFLGSTSCIVLQRRRERQVLQLLFQVTGGEDWTENSGWMDDTLDICSWHGISCREDMTIESILLGSNNLVGRPPREIFTIKNLRYLWLYANPIDFRFDGIEQAQKLTSILLDSTGLRSIDGIGMAASLIDVDIRFNSLSGTIPTELTYLRNLQSFSAGHNKFSGPVPAFSNNKKLKLLRLDNNQLTGTLSDFSEHTMLQSLDLSENQIVGRVPGSLLKFLQPDVKLFIDLSSNQLTGTLPGEITKYHSDLSIFLRDNKIAGIDKEFCNVAEFNEGDVGSFGCDAILCPPLTYQQITGRASPERGPCLPCPHATYYGTSDCKKASASDSNYKNERIFLTLALGFVTLILM
jgi:Leucine-rich repeat (LRR) protein